MKRSFFLFSMVLSLFACSAGDPSSDPFETCDDGTCDEEVEPNPSETQLSIVPVFVDKSKMGLSSIPEARGMLAQIQRVLADQGAEVIVYGSMFGATYESEEGTIDFAASLAEFDGQIVLQPHDSPSPSIYGDVQVGHGGLAQTVLTYNEGPNQGEQAVALNSLILDGPGADSDEVLPMGVATFQALLMAQGTTQGEARRVAAETASCLSFEDSNGADLVMAFDLRRADELQEVIGDVGIGSGDLDFGSEVLPSGRVDALDLLDGTVTVKPGAVVLIDTAGLPAFTPHEAGLDLTMDYLGEVNAWVLAALLSGCPSS